MEGQLPLTDKYMPLGSKMAQMTKVGIDSGKAIAHPQKHMCQNRNFRMTF